MTVQIAAPFKFGASKAALQTALTETPSLVNFADPTPFGTRGFTGADIRSGESFPVVMDPDKRTRFAKVTRRANGTFKVE